MSSMKDSAIEISAKYEDVSLLLSLVPFLSMSVARTRRSAAMRRTGGLEILPHPVRAIVARGAIHGRAAEPERRGAVPKNQGII